MSIPGHSESVRQLIQRFSDAFSPEILQHSSVVLGVSGGPDSVALLRLVSQIPSFDNVKEKLIVVYCNHNTRQTARRDEIFVRELAEKLQVPFSVKERSKENNTATTSEESLRAFRYESLIEVAHQFGARYVVTGHTKNDQVETILFRMFRGTGLSGLKGIPRIRVVNDVTIMRPLLNITKNELLQFLDEIGQEFLIDESNLDDVYTRNFLRLNVIPLIEDRFGPHAVDSIFRLGDQACQWELLIDSLVPEVHWIDRFGDRPSIQTDNLNDLDPTILLQVLKKVWRELEFPEQLMTRGKWNSMSRLVLKAANGVIQLPGDVTVRRAGDQLTFERTITVRKNKSASN